MQISILDDASHLGDVLAIPFFGLLVYYFLSIPRRTPFETILLLFAVGGFVLDVLYSTQFLTRKLTAA